MQMQRSVYVSPSSNVEGEAKGEDADLLADERASHTVEGQRDSQ